MEHQSCVLQLLESVERAQARQELTYAEDIALAQAYATLAVADVLQRLLNHLETQ